MQCGSYSYCCAVVSARALLTHSINLPNGLIFSAEQSAHEPVVVKYWFCCGFAYKSIYSICKSVYSTCMPAHSCVVSTAADPSRRPTLELCKHCRWEMCLKLCQKRCFVGAHLEPTPVAKINVVVCKAEDKLTLVEIRCPRNYLNMRDQKYIFTHTQHGCNHHPYYTCGFPHSDIEEEIWNVWKGTASANVSHRNAVC